LAQWILLAHNATSGFNPITTTPSNSAINGSIFPELPKATVARVEFTSSKSEGQIEPRSACRCRASVQIAFVAFHDQESFLRARERKAMTSERIQKGFDVFIHDGDKAVGAVRQVYLGGKPEIVIYVENAGDFVVPISAVKDVYAEKVVLNLALLSLELKQALGHAHEVEDPSV
jgi:hypothetical protein